MRINADNFSYIPIVSAGLSTVLTILGITNDNYRFLPRDITGFLFGAALVLFFIFSLASGLHIRFNCRTLSEVAKQSESAGLAGETHVPGVAQLSESVVLFMNFLCDRKRLYGDRATLFLWITIFFTTVTAITTSYIGISFLSQLFVGGASIKVDLERSQLKMNDLMDQYIQNYGGEVKLWNSKMDKVSEAVGAMGPNMPKDDRDSIVKNVASLNSSFEGFQKAVFSHSKELQMQSARNAERVDKIVEELRGLQRPEYETVRRVLVSITVISGLLIITRYCNGVYRENMVSFQRIEECEIQLNNVLVCLEHVSDKPSCDKAFLEMAMGRERACAGNAEDVLRPEIISIFEKIIDRVKK